jgi:hypothetical protein
MLLNFTWWVNRKDRFGRNVFEGGFLGLDNIGVFDRSAPLPTGGYLEQADGTAWMALFADQMLETVIELAMNEDGYDDMVLKFLEHDALITSSLVQLGGGIGMWDEEDGFFYDVLRMDDSSGQRLKIRSMVGLLPLCAATVFWSKGFVVFSASAPNCAPHVMTRSKPAHTDGTCSPSLMKRDFAECWQRCWTKTNS